MDGVWTISPDYEAVIVGGNVNNVVLPVVIEYQGSASHTEIHWSADNWKGAYEMTWVPTSQKWVLARTLPISSVSDHLMFKVIVRKGSKLVLFDVAYIHTLLSRYSL